MPNDNDGSTSTQNPRYALLLLLYSVGFLMLIDILVLSTTINDEFTTALVSVIGFITTGYTALFAKEMDKDDGKITNAEYVLFWLLLVLFGVVLIVSFASTSLVEPYHPLTMPTTTIIGCLVGMMLNMARRR